MKHEFTYAHLIAADQEMQEQMQKSATFHLFNSEKIKKFYQLNQHRINAAKAGIKKLILKHVVADEKGEPKFIDKADGSKEYVWKTAGSFNAYNVECQDFLNLTVDVFI